MIAMETISFFVMRFALAGHTLRATALYDPSYLQDRFIYVSRIFFLRLRGPSLSFPSPS